MQKEEREATRAERQAAWQAAMNEKHDPREQIVAVSPIPDQLRSYTARQAQARHIETTENSLHDSTVRRSVGYADESQYSHRSPEVRRLEREGRHLGDEDFEHVHDDEVRRIEGDEERLVRDFDAQILQESMQSTWKSFQRSEQQDALKQRLHTAKGRHIGAKRFEEENFAVQEQPVYAFKRPAGVPTSKVDVQFSHPPALRCVAVCHILPLSTFGSPPERV